MTGVMGSILYSFILFFIFFCHSAQSSEMACVKLEDIGVKLSILEKNKNEYEVSFEIREKKMSYATLLAVYASYVDSDIQMLRYPIYLEDSRVNEFSSYQMNLHKNALGKIKIDFIYFPKESAKPSLGFVSYTSYIQILEKNKNICIKH
ncbi:hypothetical protein [Microbulbifer spongiae]|uniref:DUF4426 domain-containing protein n=1 Tax=Microbulbifer spongiae TaxID=2944933 RepID=A0ABY9EDF3_9GAMM|nr:hypothetical protein [Microbulbifer sp. MI-G]WKD51053.1 hypothetical protein M8T91_06425 [Microbulbifer sp. MI-G]